jgi:threonine dehydrogenase-like Zn-dependent dehydrogenase
MPMRAVLSAGVGRVRVGEVQEPAVGDATDAVVRVTVSAICGSDLHFFHGRAPLDPGEGMGHEAVGVVDSVGDAVRHVGCGDRVVVAFSVACGTCWFCERGQTGLCERSAIFGTGLFGGGMPGAQAERLRVPMADVNLLPIPREVDDERAVFVADVLTTAVYATTLAGASSSDTVAVVGAGPVGLLCAQVLGAAGVARVIVLDRDAGRLELASRTGAGTVDVDRRNAQMTVAALTGDRGADVAIDAVGHPDAFATALDVVRRGGRVVVVGMYAAESVEAQLGVWWARGLDIRFAGVCPVHAHWHEAMRLLATGAVDPRPLVSHLLPIADAQTGYDLFDRRQATKVLLRP